MQSDSKTGVTWFRFNMNATVMSADNSVNGIQMTEELLARPTKRKNNTNWSLRQGQHGSVRKLHLLAQLLREILYDPEKQR